MFLIEKFRDGLAVAYFWILAAQRWLGHRLLFYSNSFGEGSVAIAVLSQIEFVQRRLDRCARIFASKSQGQALTDFSFTLQTA